MIRFCDKNVYTIYTYDLYRVEMLRFFLNAKDEFHRDVVLVLNADDSYYGIMTYPRIVMCENPEDRIMRESITVSENFFEEAKEWFSTHPRELLPILDRVGQVCGFCYNDGDEELEDRLTLFHYFEELDELPCPFSEFQKSCKQICIIDCNELAYRCYCLFKRMGYPVQIIGEEWEWLGVQSEEIPTTRKEKFYIYAEGAQNVRWDWTFEEKPPLVANCFSFIDVWILEIRKHIYKMIVEIFKKKGVSIYYCVAPEWKDIEYFTDLEIKSVFYQLSIEKAVLGKIVKKREKELLCKTMGDMEVELLYDQGLYLEEKGFRRLSYTAIVQEALNDAEGEGRIYVIGPCIAEGYGNFTENMFATQLQNIVRKEKYTVVKMPLTRWNWHLYSRKEIEKIPLRKKDIVLFLDRKSFFEETVAPKLDLSPIYNAPGRETWMLSHSLHLNKAGTKVIAEETYKFLREEIQKRNKTITENVYLQKGEILSDSQQDKIREYLEKVRECNRFEKNSRIGSIVMNCNPFTYGHQYLIEYAASKVDALYIFVVEENRSMFSFELRKRMVEEGTKHLNNVCVVSSGEWVLSYQTFPIYFGKTKMQEEKADARLDLEIFARYIAPPLGITYRFVGEEPSDKITKQYNEQMAEILNEFQICFEEVPRKKVDGNVISASYVRRCIEEENFAEIEKYVPESTMKILSSCVETASEED